MDMLSWLLAGHMAGDYLFQNRWMAGGKSEKWLPLFVHSAVYTLSVALFAFLGGGLKIQGLVIIFLSHAALDQRAFVMWWARRVTQSSGIPWLVVMIDQAWHIVILALASLI